MAKTLQFRCPLCNRLLIKWEVGSEKCIYKVIELTADGRTQCTKCQVKLIFKDSKFIADTEKEPSKQEQTSDTLE